MLFLEAKRATEAEEQSTELAELGGSLTAAASPLGRSKGPSPATGSQVLGG